MSITEMSIINEVPKINQRLADKCPECTNKNLVHDYDTGETICGACGLVLYERMLDKAPEWRSFTQQGEASRSRVGMPTSYSIHDKGLSTTISQVDRDAFGRKLPISTRLQIWRLGNGKYGAECTHPPTETSLKLWVNLNVYQAK